MKRFVRYSLGITIALLVMVFPLYAKAAPKPNQFYNQFRFSDSTKKYTKVKFKFINNHIIIPFSVNGSDSLMFILDTGLSGVMVTALQDNRVLTLNYARKIMLQGLGKGKSIEALASTQNTFRMPDIIGENVDIMVAMDDIFDFSIRTGMVINGIIGGIFFKNFIVEIDYPNRELKIWNPKYYKRSKMRKYKQYDLELPDDKCFVKFNVTSEGKTSPMKFLVDSGLSNPIWIDTRSETVLVPTENSIHSYLGYGLNGDIYGKVSRIPAVRIGNFSFKNIIVAFPDTAYIGSAANLNYRNGSIGSEVLRRFKVVLNYPDKKIGLRPNSNFKNVFFLDMSGIEVGSITPGFPGYKIISVRANSPADKAGLRVDDQLISINEKFCLTMKMNDLMGILNGKKGDVIRMEVLREGDPLKVQFILKDVL